MKTKSTKEMIGYILSESGRPLGITEVISCIEDKFNIKKTKQQIRNAVNQYDCREIVRVSRENYDLLSRVVNGIYFRYTLSDHDAEKGALSCDNELCFIFDSIYRKNEQAIMLEPLDEIIAANIEFCGAEASPRRIIRGLDAWYKKWDLCPGDDVIIKVIDYDNAVYEIKSQKKEARNEELISRKNREIADLLFSIVNRINLKGASVYKLIQKIVCEYSFRDECPPDMISYVAGNDSRFGIQNEVQDIFRGRLDGIYLKGSSFFKNVRSDGYFEKPVGIRKTKTEWICQIHVSLDRIEPLIWRRIQVPSNYTFWDLHVAIQDAMGWLDYHLHEFRLRDSRAKKEVFIGVPCEEDCDIGKITLPCWDEQISNWLNPENNEAKYLYDFGDGWSHTVKFEGIMLREENIQYPRCIGGARACPTEDVGGTFGYMDFIAAIKNPAHEQHKLMLEWIGGGFEPEKFNMDDVIFDDPDERLELLEL